jgi:hypothetical protein
VEIRGDLIRVLTPSDGSGLRLRRFPHEFELLKVDVELSGQSPNHCSGLGSMIEANLAVFSVENPLI